MELEYYLLTNDIVLGRKCKVVGIMHLHRQKRLSGKGLNLYRAVRLCKRAGNAASNMQIVTHNKLHETA